MQKIKVIEMGIEIYATESVVRSLTGLTVAALGTAALGTIMAQADTEIENITGKIWDGLQTDEFIGRGNGTISQFYISYPAVLSALETGGGTVTNTAAAITVSVDNTTVESTTYTLDGKKGLITFTSGNEPSANAKIEATYFYSRSNVKEAANLIASSYALSRMINNPESPQPPYWLNRAKEILANLPNEKILFGWSN